MPAQSIELFNDQLCETFYDFIKTDPMFSLASKAVLLDQNVLEYLSAIQMYCAPQVPVALVQDSPPTFEFFLQLPSVANIDRAVLRASYLVYVACLWKHGCVPLAGIGSASRLDGGAVKRVDEYFRGTTLPFYVKKALDEGYVIVHIGVVLLIDMPVYLRSPINRLWTLLFEAHYTYKFWTVHQSPDKTVEQLAEHKWGHLCPWNVDQFEYKGVNSHSPLSEKPQGLELTMDQFVQIAVQARERRREYMKIYNKKYHAAMMETVRAVGEGLADTSDPTVQAWLLQYEDHSARNKKAYADMKETVKAVAAGTMDASDTHVQAQLLRHQKFQDKNANIKQGRALLKKIKNGEVNESDLDTDDQKLAKIGRESQECDNKHAEKKRQGVDLCRRVDAGEVSKLTPNQEKLVEIGRKELVRRANSMRKQAEKKAAAKKAAEEISD